MLKNKKIVTLISVIVLLAAGGGVIFYYSQNTSIEDTPLTTDPITQDINTDPPTEEEKQAADDSKERIVREEEQRSSQQGSKRQVKPIISSWGQSSSGSLEVNGFVSEIIETGGTCTLTISKNGTTLSAKSAGSADAQTTTCGEMIIGSGSLSPGQWSATLAYTSSKAEGKSNPTTVEIN